MTLQVGDLAPKIALKDQNGKLKTSQQLLGKTYVLFFYPKDDTPGCTMEVCGFRDNYELFKKLGVEILGVSGDSEKSHQNFSKRHNLPYSILSDEENKLRKAFGIPKSLGFIPSRITFIINKEGKILNCFNNLLDAQAHIKNALNILNSSNNS